MKHCIQIQKKEKENCCLVSTSSTKREIRKADDLTAHKLLSIL